MRTLLCGALLCFLPGSASLALTGLSGGAESIPHEEQTAPSQATPATRSGVPQILERPDIALYQRIFALQEEGRWGEADALIAQLSDDRLMGHVLHQRYMHPTDYRSSYPELADWLANYADHPDAASVYGLAIQRKPAEASAPRKPEGGGNFKIDYVLSTALTQDRGVSDLLQEIAATPGEFGGSDPTAFPSFTVGRGTAGSWSMPGDREQLEEISNHASALAVQAAPRTNWNKGLEAWKDGDIAAAAAHFQSIVIDDDATRWLRSAGAYWAARAALRLGQPQEMSQWLREALESPRSFYGLLAQQALGTPPQFSFDSLDYDPIALSNLL
ncbi:MAG TPA: hypothetical protein VK092_00525, partial [Deinococcales bacterium]|nr:hypothetical protein [Deinococcales bacterium]